MPPREVVGYSLRVNTYHLLKADGDALCGRRMSSITTEERALERGLRLCSLCRVEEAIKARGSTADSQPSYTQTTNTLESKGMRPRLSLDVTRLRMRWEYRRVLSEMRTRFTQVSRARSAMLARSLTGLTRFGGKLSSLRATLRERFGDPSQIASLERITSPGVVAVGVAIASFSVSLILFARFGP